MMGEKKQYRAVFKQEAVRLQVSSGKTVAEVEPKLGLSHGLLRRIKKSKLTIVTGLAIIATLVFGTSSVIYARYQTLSSTIFSIVWSPNGSKLAFGGDNGTVEIYNICPCTLLGSSTPANPPALFKASVNCLIHVSRRWGSEIITGQPQHQHLQHTAWN